MYDFSCRPILIGSLPMTDHTQALDVIFEHTPSIPLWPQLPRFDKEAMVRQFADGLPGLTEKETSVHIQTDSPDYPDEMTSFYQDYLHGREQNSSLGIARFSLTRETANGFYALLERVARRKDRFLTLKGQVTGPMTTGIGIRNQEGSSIFYDENMRDMVTKLIAMKARWQVEQLRPFCADVPPVILIDEPGLVSFGSTALAGVSREMVTNAVSEVIIEIQDAGGLAGVHICANGDWEPVLNSTAAIVSFDAYSFFENFILYKQQLTSFINRGGVLAWGIVPTAGQDTVERETTESLLDKWNRQLSVLIDLGISRERLLKQTLIAPACGTGSLPLGLAIKVLKMTSELSKVIRTRFF